MEDKEILDGLYKKRLNLVKELQKVDTAIIAFGGSIETVNEVKKPIKIPAEYPINSTWKDKIIFTLTKIAVPASTVEIADYIKTQEQDKDISNLISTIGMYCSDLGVKGQLDRVKDGKKYLYKNVE